MPVCPPTVGNSASGFSRAMIRSTVSCVSGSMYVRSASSGSVRKFISVPFSVDVREIVAAGRTVRVPLGAASAFGGIPVPQFLFGLVRNRLPAELVRYEDPATLVFSLDRFLPTFIEADIQT